MTILTLLKLLCLITRIRLFLFLSSPPFLFRNTAVTRHFNTSWNNSKSKELQIEQNTQHIKHINYSDKIKITAAGHTILHSTPGNQLCSTKVRYCLEVRYYLVGVSFHFPLRVPFHLCSVSMDDQLWCHEREDDTRRYTDRSHGCLGSRNALW